MLHLTLRQGEHVMIGNNIRVKYTSNKGNNIASLAIDAPREVAIERGNVYEERIMEKASKGDSEAAQLLEQLNEEKKIRRKIFNRRKGKRQHLAALHRKMA